MRESFDFDDFKTTNEAAFANITSEERIVASRFPKDVSDVKKWAHRISF